MKVGIVGAGITGLALTHYLAERDVESVTFEANSEPGGVISTRTVDGHVLEGGPQRMRNTPGIKELVRVAGLENEVIEAAEEDLYVYTGGGLREAPLTKRQFLRTDLLSWRGKIRLLAEPLTRPGRPEETVEEVFSRKFGREAYERFIGPLYGGLYGSDPGSMPAAFALEGLLALEDETGSLLRAFRKRVGSGHQSAPISFTEGNQQLPDALYREYRNRIRLDTPVTDVSVAVSNADDGTNGHTYSVRTRTETFEFDTVVVTTAAPTAAELLKPLDDGIASGIDRLSTLRYNPLALVYLDARSDRPGKGYQVALSEDLRTLGVSWNDRMFGRDGVHTAFLGGMHDPDILESDDDELGRVAREEFETVMGVDAAVIDVTRLRPGFPAWDQTWWNLEHVELPEDVILATNYTARMGIPSRVREAREIAERLDTNRA